jgi:GTP-binding protein HflX
LKSSQIKQLQRLYHQRLPNDCLTTVEFAQRLGALSLEVGNALSVYLNRRGQVIRVGVGTPRQTQIPPLEIPRYGAERLSGIRCLATSFDEAPPKEASLTALALQRLDALLILSLTGTGFTRRGGGATGYIQHIYLAHLTPTASGVEDLYPPCQVSAPLPLESVERESLLALTNNLEAEFVRNFTAQEVDSKSERVLLVGVQTAVLSELIFAEGLAELERLVATAGGQVVGTVVQKREQPHPRTVLGEGKVAEIALKIQTCGATLVAFDRELSPSQVRNLEVQWGVRVVDRTEVILDIFAQRAQSQAGKLQVELAQLDYMMPRLTGQGRALSRLGGGIGTRGPGETKLETERRTLQKRIAKLRQEVAQLQSHRDRLRQKRQKGWATSIAIVGYTNAGKSTLINALTDSDIYTADQLFATLDPTTRRLRVPREDGSAHLLLLTDTVGFIRELPHSLVEAFKATLEEVTEADALLQVVDLSHPAWRRQLTSVGKILAEMPLVPGPMAIAFNKIDQVTLEVIAEAKAEYPQAVFVSAREKIGLAHLKQCLLNLE